MLCFSKKFFFFFASSSVDYLKITFCKIFPFTEMQCFTVLFVSCRYMSVPTLETNRTSVTIPTVERSLQQVATDNIILQVDSWLISFIFVSKFNFFKALIKISLSP